MKQWLQKNKVLIFGGISAICVGVYGTLAQSGTDWMAIGYAAFVGLGSYVVNQARGPWITIAGAVLGSAATIYNSYKTGVHLDATQLMITIAVNIGMAASGPVKPSTYEKAKTIRDAEIPPLKTGLK